MKAKAGQYLGIINHKADLLQVSYGSSGPGCMYDTDGDCRNSASVLLGASFKTSGTSTIALRWEVHYA